MDGHDDEDTIQYRQKVWLPQEKKEELRQYKWYQMKVQDAKAAGIAYIDGAESQLDKITNTRKKKRLGSIPLHIVQEAILRRQEHPQPSWAKLANELSMYQGIIN